jgi:hypothetical protein
VKDFLNVRNFLSVVVVTVLLVGCGGRAASPVMVNQFGDASKSCDALQFEMNSIQSEIQRLLPKKDKTGKNVALGVTGFFLIVPLFFMDFKNAEAQEYEAYRQRYNHLASIAMTKECHIEKEEYLSIEQMRQEYEKQKQKEERELMQPDVE